MKTTGFKHNLYLVMRVHAWIIGLLYVKSINIKGKENFDTKRGALLAATHPNSFLDSIVCQINLKKPIWSLARGDAFKKGFIGFILTTVKMLPIYRLSEGKHNMVKNEATFEDCKELFKLKENVIIFSEGLCKNQTKLLPLKKGTARLAIDSWKRDINVQVIPTSITYNDFKSWGRIVNINYNKAIEASDFDLSTDDATLVNVFNEKLKQGIEEQLSYDFKDNGFFKNPVYYIGWLINFPLYLLIGWLVKKKFGKTIFYDSIMYFALYLLVPIYVPILLISLFSIF